jgi:hypothetical protein
MMMAHCQGSARAVGRTHPRAWAISFDCRVASADKANLQTFFGSFFQKRTALLFEKRSKNFC